MRSEWSGSRGAWGTALLLASMWASGTAVAAAEEDTSPATRTVVIGKQYQAGAVHRWRWGADYRDLYATPVELPVLDLDRFAGGLTVVSTLGHGQTKAVKLQGADGHRYTFRPILKDPSGLLPVELRETAARALLTDQMASEHPAGHVVAPGLLAPAGILHNTPRLVVMPDDPRLGEFRGDLANVVGDIEEWTGTPGFGGTIETLDGAQMWDRLRASATVRPDSRAYLKARLVDQLMGDWDRHRDQWRWGRVPGKDRWQPIPEDRDQAFVRFEGALIALLRIRLPLLVQFGPAYSALAGLTFDGWDVDKRILGDLEWPTWRDVAEELQAELTDDVIEAAARRSPPSTSRGRQAAHRRSEARRDGLPRPGPGASTATSTRRRRLLHRRPRACRRPTHFENGDLELSVRPLSADGGMTTPPYFRRRFEASVTHEVRVYLHGGTTRSWSPADTKGCAAPRSSEATAVTMLDDSAGGGTRFSAARAGPRAVNLAAPARTGTGGTTRPRPQQDRRLDPGAGLGPPQRAVVPLVLRPDNGVLIGGSLNTTGYGFRTDPSSDQQTLRLVYSTKESRFRGTYLGQFRFENSPFRVGPGGPRLRDRGLALLRLRNTSTYQGSQDNYKLEQDRLHRARPRLHGEPPSRPLPRSVAKYDRPKPTRDNPVLAEQPSLR